MSCERMQHSNSNSFPLSFSIWVQKFPSYNVSRIENFEIQITYCFEYFLEPRIWEIVPDCIKKVTALRISNWKKNYGIQKTVHAGCAKGSYRRLFYIICLLIFYAAYFIIFVSFFHFVLESILNQSCLLL